MACPFCFTLIHCTPEKKEQGQICLTNAGRKFHKDSKRKKMEIEIQIQHFGLRRV
jgi:hypothetical protein